MTISSFRTPELHQQIERLRAGDRDAQEDLVRAVTGRVERIARTMLRGYPAVQRWADVDDVLQQALLRLLAALRTIRPNDTQDFFRLAAYLIRQELIDLSRRFEARCRSESAASVVPQQSPAHFDAWDHFHQAIEQLPVEEREVLSLLFYHGATQTQVAEVLGVDVRTVRRRWVSACQKLRDTLADDLDELFR